MEANKKIDSEGNIVDNEFDIFDNLALEDEPKQELKDNPPKYLEPGTVDQRTWKELRETGLLLLINQFLHIFGWAIVMRYSEEDDRLLDVFPARVKHRSFRAEAIYSSYRKIATYMKNNAENLEKEAYEQEKINV